VAAQATAVFLDGQRTLEKACELIAEAGRARARLIAFPEAFIPTYPDWVWAVPPGEEGLLNDLYAELLANAVTIPSDVTDRLCRAAQRQDHRRHGHERTQQRSQPIVVTV